MPVNDTTTKRHVALQEGRIEIHAVRLDALRAVDRAFDEIEYRLLLLEKREAARVVNTRAA